MSKATDWHQLKTEMDVLKSKLLEVEAQLSSRPDQKSDRAASLRAALTRLENITRRFGQN